MLLFSPLRSSPFRGLGRAPSFSFEAKCRTFPDIVQKKTATAFAGWHKKLPAAIVSNNMQRRRRRENPDPPLADLYARHALPASPKPPTMHSPTILFFPHVATDLLLPQKYAPHSFATQWREIKAAAETPAGGKEKRRRDGTQGAHFPEFCFPSPKRKE